MKRTLIGAFAVIALILAGSAAGKATTIGGSILLTGCPGTGCPDATYAFTVSNTTASLTIHIANDGTLNSTNDLIQGVDLGFTPSANISGLSVNGPTGTSSWTDGTGSISSNKCGGNSGAFVFDCALVSGSISNSIALSITGSDSYTWTWTYGFIPDSDFVLRH